MAVATDLEPRWETEIISRPALIAVLSLGLVACASEPPGVFRADGSAAYLGPKEAVVLESREAEVEDPYAVQNHSGAAYGGAVFSAVVANSLSDDNGVVALAILAGTGIGWMLGEWSEETLPGHVYVVKDKASGDVYTVVQPMRANDWLLPPGTEVVVVGESRAARVVPETEAPEPWGAPDADLEPPPEVWVEPEPEWDEPEPY